MGGAYSEDLAWRVVMRVVFFGQGVSEICDPERGLGVSSHYISDVMARYEDTGDVKTRQGQRTFTIDQSALTRAEDWKIMALICNSPRTQLKDIRAQFQLDTGVLIKYRAFCGAVQRLGFTRKKVRTQIRPSLRPPRLPKAQLRPLAPRRTACALCLACVWQVRALAYRCDVDNALHWLAGLLRDYRAEELAVLDETSKDMDVLKGDFGYSLRGEMCQVQDQVLTNASRTSMLALYTLDEGFLDWAMTPGTWNKESFLHVTTERFCDWRGVMRRPMLVRGQRCYPNLRACNTVGIVPPPLPHTLHVRRRRTSIRRKASVAACCLTTRPSITVTSSSTASQCWAWMFATSRLIATSCRRWTTVLLALSFGGCATTSIAILCRRCRSSARLRRRCTISTATVAALRGTALGTVSTCSGGT